VTKLDYLDQKAFLARLAPFNQLPDAELDWLAESLRAEHFPAGEVLLNAREVPACLYIVMDGAVQELDGETAISLYTAEDTFDARALLEGISKTTFVVTEPARCFLLPRPLFLHAVQAHPTLAAFYNQKISQRLASLRAAEDRQEMAGFTVAKIRDAYIHAPILVGSETSIHAAALAMKAHKTKPALSLPLICARRRSSSVRRWTRRWDHSLLMI